ncbi:unnamed protein product [Symbiodinium sp. CCMP2592]|nr:unnamed protein product [Symbiodinium sp. CCMP2592]
MAEASRASAANQEPSGASGKVEELLCKPFDEALKHCPALAEYIQKNSTEDSGKLEKEFREHWHREAPQELRQVLEEIVDPEAAAANVAETEAFLRNRTPLVEDLLSEGAEQSASSDRLVVRQELSREQGLDIDHDQEDDQFADLDIASAVDRLLSLSFEAAMKTSVELRDYVRSPKRSKDEIADLEAEFAQNWSLEAPTELRDILEELLFPDVVASRQARESRAPIARL